ncbi:hypothetical protein GDO81_027694 [Engystomops pustulosus]|uniref:Vomeronasal type-1 receptor n=1 Tax=Engystomops pustulosus TaxID=76066 RepID=A0AAV6YP79_ENGPU|nr:hypothetical protein GDO81_027694 [Engystomops pustulosus]
MILLVRVRVIWLYAFCSYMVLVLKIVFSNGSHQMCPGSDEASVWSLEDREKRSSLLWSCLNVRSCIIAAVMVCSSSLVPFLIDLIFWKNPSR